MSLIECVKNFECDIIESSVNRRRKYFPDIIDCVANIEFESLEGYKWIIKHTYILFEDTEEDLEKKIEEGRDLGLVNLTAFVELDVDDEILNRLTQEKDLEEIKIDLIKIVNFITFPKCKEIVYQLLRAIDAPYIEISMPKLDDIIIHGDDDNVGQSDS